ncbi:MAG: hypothetical protein M3335_08485 [Actinomycetota bacterium]|nr:hypothetical protein [Actinomycetota bacterium]
MPYYDNPAGRLHELLAKLAEQDRRISVLDAWATVLRVEPDDVVVHLGRVADLVRQTQDAVDRAGEDALLPPVQRYRASWAQPIFPQDHAFSGALGKVLPDVAALEALDLISAQLHSIAPEGVVPDEDELERLKSQIRDLIDGVQAADDVPDEVKHLVISRLRAVEEAVEHLDVGGPSAIRRATEAVMGSVLFAQDAQLAKSPTIQTVWTTLLVIWTVFSAGPTIQTSIEAWKEMAPLLSAKTEQSPGASAPGSSPDLDGHSEDSR